LADFVVKRHAIIIVVWIILLLVSVPLMLNMGDVIAYQETEFVDMSYESQRASAIIKEKFPSDSSNSSMVLVIIDNDLTAPDKRDLVLRLEADITGASGLKYFESTTSIYDIYEMALESTIGPLASNMTPAQEQVNQSLQMFFGIPANYAMTYDLMSVNSPFFKIISYNYFSTYDGVNTTSSLVYGVALSYLDNYTKSSFNSSAAYNWTKANLTLAMLDPINGPFISLYYQNFTWQWNESTTLNPFQRMNESISLAVNSIIPYFPAQYGLMLQAVNSYLTSTTFQNPMSLSNAAYNIMNTSLAPAKTDQINTTLIMGVLGITDGYWRGSFYAYPTLSIPARNASIMPSVDLALKLFISDFTKSIIQANFASFLPADSTFTILGNKILNITHEIWNSSVNATPSMSTAQRLNESLIPMQENYTVAIQTAGLFPKEELALLSELTVTGGNFGLSNYTNTSVQHTFILDMFSDQADISNMTFLQEVYELGANASDANVSALAWKVVREGTIGNYPIDLPAGVLNSLLSDDHETMLLMVSFTKSSTFREANGTEPITKDVDIVREVARVAMNGNSNLQIYVTGDAPINADMSRMADNDLQLIEPITICLVLILMGLFFRSVLGPIIPLASIGAALGVSQAAIFIIGTYVAQVHYIVPIMLIAILFGVGTDYSIFILARYREELLKGAEREDAMRTSITWAGESIATSGATVILAFAAMASSSFSMLTTMGLVLSVAVLIALLVALTLVPSIALMLKGKIFWPISGERWTKFRENYLKKRIRKRGGYFRKAAKFSTRRAVPIIIVAILITVPATYIFMTGATSFDFINGMGQTESVEGLNAMMDSFGSGRISPTQIVMQFDQLVILPNGNFSISMLGTIENLSASLLADNSNVREIDGPSRPNGDYVNYTNISSLPIAERISLEMQMKSFVGNDNKTVIIDAIYVEEPLTQLSMDTTREIRTQLATPSSDPNMVGVVILIGGESASLVDVDKVTSSQFSQMEVIVIVGVFIVLVIVLGSIVLPLFAILSIGLSIIWTLAVSVLLFDNLLGKPVLWIMPIIIFIILMGLGMDYNIFILTRVREETSKSKNHEQAIIEAVDRTGGIITACAVIMAGAFGSIMLSSTTMLEEFGFALAFAVLIDAMVVRTYITPAFMKILGPRLAWLGPKRLRRLDPKLISSEHFEDKEL
jgi:RND superfamily putative drug exporter